jgi:hypothetical protein
MIEKEHVIQVLKEVERAVKVQDVFLLRELSDKTIHSASVYQDPDSIALAVTIYALSKVFSKTEFRYYKDWNKFLERTTEQIVLAYEFLEKDNLKMFRKKIIKIRKEINIFGHLKEYIKNVFYRASINKASRIYEHGISRAETSRLLGISQWELASYAIAPAISDVDLSLTMPIKDRIKFTEELFEK